MKPITVHQQWADFIEQALEWLADVGGPVSDRPSFSVRDADVLRRLSDRVREKANYQMVPSARLKSHPVAKAG